MTKHAPHPGHVETVYTNHGCLLDILRQIFNLKMLFKAFCIALMVMALIGGEHFVRYIIKIDRVNLKVAETELRSSQLEVEINQFILSCERKRDEELWNLPEPDKVGKGKVKK